jgi:glycosyltransferase involved in cell wall biosynthesis
MTPLVSVVIPSYNHRTFIGEAIASVRSQTHQPLELIVIDDGSTDGSFEYIRDEWARAVTHLKRHDNRGAHATLNEAISLATGEWISILNSDDVYEAARIAKLCEFASRNSYDLVFSDVAFRNERGPLASDHKVARSHGRATAAAARGSVEQALLRGNFALTTSNLMFRRTAYDTVGAFRPFRYCHDWDFLLRAVGRIRMGWLAEPLLSYRLHAANTIREPDPWRHLTENALVYASFVGEGRATDNAAVWGSDYVFESRELSPVIICWLLSECRRIGYISIFRELESGVLHQRVRAAFEPHFGARGAGLTVRDIHKRLRGGILRSSLERLRNQLTRPG